MPASPKLSYQPHPEPAPAAAWSGWMDLAVGFGQAMIACQLMLAALALSTLPAAHLAPRSVRLALVHSRRTAAVPARRRPRPFLHAVRRDEGQA